MTRPLLFLSICREFLAPFPYFFLFSGLVTSNCLIHSPAYRRHARKDWGKKVNYPSWVDVSVAFAQASITAYKTVRGICARQTLPDAIGQIS